MESLFRECEKYGVDISAVTKSTPTPCSEEEAFRLRIERLLHLKKLEFYEFAELVKDDELMRLRGKLASVRQTVLKMEIELRFLKKNYGTVKMSDDNDGPGVLGDCWTGSDSPVITSVRGNGQVENRDVHVDLESSSLYNENYQEFTEAVVSRANSLSRESVSASASGVENESMGKEVSNDFMDKDSSTISVKMESTSSDPNLFQNMGIDISKVESPLESSTCQSFAQTSHGNDFSNSEDEDDTVKGLSDSDYHPPRTEDTVRKVHIKEDQMSNFPPTDCDQGIKNNQDDHAHSSHSDGDGKCVICPECLKTLSNIHGLKRHQRTVHGGTVFKCHFCSKAFSRSDNLKQHEKLHVNGTSEIVPFSCNFCKKTYFSSTQLKHHMRFAHPYETFKLENESKRSGSGKASRPRPRVPPVRHHTPKSWKCSDCGQIMTRKSYLANHVLRFHSDGQGLKFKCSICPKRYISQKKLNMHTKFAHKCRFCEELFSEAHDREDHEKGHLVGNQKY